MPGLLLDADLATALTGATGAARALRDLVDRGVAQWQTSLSPYGPARVGLAPRVGEWIAGHWDLTETDRRLAEQVHRWADGAPADLSLEQADSIVTVARHLLATGRPAEAAIAARTADSALLLSGRWERWTDAVRVVGDAARRLDDTAGKAWALHQNGTRALCVGDRSTAEWALREALRLRLAIGDETGAAVTRHNLDLLRPPPPPPLRDDDLPALRGGRLRLAPWVRIASVLAPLVILAVGGLLALRPAPSLALDPADVAFGARGLSLAGSNQTLELRNNRDDDVRLQDVTVTGPEAADFPVRTQTCAGATLRAGDRCTITVGFIPTAIGPRTATLTVDVENEAEHATATLVGDGAAPLIDALAAEPRGVSFGEQPTATTSTPRAVTLTGHPDREVTIGAITITADSLAFDVVEDRCGGAVLAPGGSCAITVAFRPPSSGPQRGVLTIEVPGVDNLEIPMDGTGTDALSSPEPGDETEPETDGPTADGNVNDGDGREAGPILLIPGDLSVEADSRAGTAVVYDVSAEDAGGKELDPVCRPASGTTFSIGSTTVECSVVDGEERGRTGSFTVTVVDAPPMIDLPGDLQEEAVSEAGADVNYSVEAQDTVDGDVEVECDPVSGRRFPFPLGTTTVTCSAEDSAGNTASGTFNVTVVDTQPPDLSLSTPLRADSRTGQVESGAPSAVDAVDGQVTVTCEPSLDGAFEFGSTTVTCSATDAAGNMASDVLSVDRSRLIS